MPSRTHATSIGLAERVGDGDVEWTDFLHDGAGQKLVSAESQLSEGAGLQVRW